MSAVTSAPNPTPTFITTIYTPILVEVANSRGTWRITSWTNELADKVVQFLINNRFPFYSSGNPPSIEQAQRLVNGARKRAEAGIPFTRFPVLNSQDEVIGEFAIGFSDDTRKLEMAGRGLEAAQGQRIGTEIMQWCLTEYLPALHAKGYRLPVFEKEQDSLPWDERRVREWVDLTTVSVVATANPNHEISHRLLTKAGFRVSGEVIKPGFSEEGIRNVYEIALAPFIEAYRSRSA